MAANGRWRGAAKSGLWPVGGGPSVVNAPGYHAAISLGTKWKTGQEFSSNTVGIPCTERHRWAEGRGAPAIWFSSNEVRTRSENFAGGGMLNGMEHSNQGPSRTLNGMERSVRGVRGSNLGSELNFFITRTRAEGAQGADSEGDGTRHAGVWCWGTSGRA